MDKDKLETIWRMIEKECQRNSLMDLLELWDLTINDWYEFESLVFGNEQALVSQKGIDEYKQQIDNDYMEHTDIR